MRSCIKGCLWAIGYKKKDGVKEKQRLVPKKYKIRFGDAQINLEGVGSSVYTQTNTTLLKEPGLFCFLLSCKNPMAESLMGWAVETVLPREGRKLASIIEEKEQKIFRLNEEIDDLIANRHVAHCGCFDNMLCFIRKNSKEVHPYYVIRCQYRQLEKHKRWLKHGGG